VLGEVLGEGYRERCIGRRWLWNLSKVWAKEGKDCCAAIVRVRPGLRRLLGSEKWLRIPAWVNGEVDLPLSPDTLASGNVKKDLRKIQKNALTFEVTRDIDAFDDFYRNMHVPYIERVHGDGAIVTSYEDGRDLLECGELILVSRQGRRIAGGLISYRDVNPHLMVMGVRDANREFVREGAIGARYHFSFCHLTDKGFTRANVGKSRAFLHNGVLRYKKKLGLRLVGPTDGYFYLRVPQDSDASRAFLMNNPMILASDGSLQGIVFVEADVRRFSDEDFSKLAREYFYEGLSQLRIVGFDAGTRPAEVPDRRTSTIGVGIASEILGFGRSRDR
jgi:hypothetical protein